MPPKADNNRHLVVLLGACLLMAVLLSSCSEILVSLQLMGMTTSDSAADSENTILLDTPQLTAYDRPTAAAPHLGLPLAAFQLPDFTGSGLCHACHHLLTDNADNPVSITSHWRSTMMANAARDPFWLAKVRSEIARHPALAGVIEKKCATCHMPMAWTEAQAVNGYGEVAIFGSGFFDRHNSLHDAAMDGVSCTLCHQIKDKDLGTEASFSGGFTIDTDTEPPGRILYGPYRNPTEGPMKVGEGFTPQFGSHTNDSALCATCHTLFTPYLDKEGNIAGKFPEQTPYLEWLHSDYGAGKGTRYDLGENPELQTKNCQECHMPHAAPGKVLIARYAPPKTEERDHFSQHFFVGGNVFMLDLFQNNTARLGLTASSQQFAETMSRTVQLLSSQSGRLSFGNCRIRGTELAVTVAVENLAGHKFPTGFPSRRLWLHLAVLDREGRIIFESGKPLADGTIVGNDNDLDPAVFEPHYSEITDPGQVQIYETIMADTDGQVTYTLLRAARYAKDNRLLPKGFAKEGAAAEIAVYGDAVGDADFVGGGDQIVYRINTGGFDGPFTVTAELLYDSLTPAFLSDLFKDGKLDEVARFARLAATANMMPTPVAAAAILIK